MSSQLSNTLRALLTARKAEALKKGWGGVPEWVTCNEDGGPLAGDNLRHSYASLLLQQGESPAYVKDQMGHSSIQVTVDISPDSRRQSGGLDRLDDATVRNPGATGTTGTAR